MRQIQARRHRAARWQGLDEEPDTEFGDPVIRQARKSAAEAQEEDDEGPGEPGDRA